MPTSLIHRLALLSVLWSLTAGAGAAPDTTRKWAFLADSYWYVPTKNLTAYVYDPARNSVSPLADQTAFYIKSYANGYFVGEIVGKLAGQPAACMALLGSVTPEGAVYLSINQQPYVEGTTPTLGLGRMVKKGNQWTMENQMSTGNGSSLVGHWAYMVQAKPGDAAWRSLPGVDMSMPEFLDQCPDSVPTSP